MTEQLTPETLNQQIRCVSHEIRNHLSICDMYSQVIKMEHGANLTLKMQLTAFKIR